VILVLNSGSSSVKYSVIEPDSATEVAEGIVERIGDSEVADHDAAMRVVFDELADHLNGSSRSAIVWCTVARTCTSRQSSTTR